MEKSQLEQISDRILYHLCHIIYTKLGGEIPEFDDDFFVICNSVSKLFGYSLDYIDYDFLLNLLSLNDFSEKTPKEINKPKVSMYGFDYDEFQTQWVRNTYYNTISSYSKESDIFNIVEKMNHDGNFEYYDGNHTDTETYDSEVTEVKVDKTSLHKLKR